jgi:hypothetical protein
MASISACAVRAHPIADQSARSAWTRFRAALTVVRPANEPASATVVAMAITQSTVIIV